MDPKTIISNLPLNLMQSLKQNQSFALIQRLDPSQSFILTQSLDPKKPYAVMQPFEPNKPINTNQLSASIQTLTPNRTIKTVSFEPKKISSYSDTVRIGSVGFYIEIWVITVYYSDGSSDTFILYLYFPY